MKDIFGKLLWDYFTKKENEGKIERDDGYLEKSSSDRYFWPYKKWPGVEKRAMKYVKGRVLDVGCGAGRHSLWLQQKGYNVTGIDISPLALKICRLRGLKNTRRMSLFSLKFKQTFDTIMLMYNNFGLAGTIPKTRKLLKDLYKITTKEGIIIASTIDYKRTKNPAHLAYHKRNKKRGLPQGQVRIRHLYKGHPEPWFNLLMVTPKELRELLKGTGWKIKKLIKNKAAEYIMILEKELK